MMELCYTKGIHLSYIEIYICLSTKNTLKAEPKNDWLGANYDNTTFVSSQARQIKTILLHFLNTKVCFCDYDFLMCLISSCIVHCHICSVFNKIQLKWEFYHIVIKLLILVWRFTHISKAHHFTKRWDLDQ